MDQFLQLDINLSTVLPLMTIIASQRGTSDSVAYFSVLSNPADAKNVSCLGLCGRDICPNSYA